MAYATSDEVRIAVVEEAAAGTTPATPVFDILRLNSESITANFNTVDSQELTTARGQVDAIPAGQSVSGSIEAYACPNDVYQSFLAAILGSSTTPFTTGSVTPGSALTSYTLEKTIPDSSGSSHYWRVAGLVPNSVTINASPNEPVTWSFGFMGGEFSRATSIVGGATYDPPTPAVNTATPYLADDMAITFGAAALGGPFKVTAASLTIDSQNREIECVAQTLGYVALGKLRVSMELTVLFENLEAYDYLTNPSTARGTGSFDLNHAGSAGDIEFDFDSIMVENVENQTPGASQEVVATMSLVALTKPAGNQVTITV